MDQSQGQGRDLLYVQDLASIRQGTKRLHSKKEHSPKKIQICTTYFIMSWKGFVNSLQCIYLPPKVNRFVHHWWLFSLFANNRDGKQS